MSKSGHSKKKKDKSPGQSYSRPHWSFSSFISGKYTGLTIAAVYLVVVGLISFLFHKVGDFGIETDFYWGYVPSAKRFLAGEIAIDAFRGPLYPIVLGIFGFLINDFFHAGILIAVLSASVVLFVTFELLKNIFSVTVSFFVTILLALNTVFIQYSYSAGTDMFFNALAALTLYFFFKTKTVSYKNLLIAAIFGGLSYLTRYNGIFLASFVFVILFVNYLKISWTDRIKAAFVFTSVFVITFSPWGFYNLSEKGSFFYNENYKNIAYEVYGKEKMSWDDFWFSERSKITSLGEVVTKDTGLFFETVLGNISGNFLSDMEKLVGWFTGAFVILGWFLLLLSNPFKRWKEEETGYYLVNLFFFSLLLLVFYSERFSLFLIPFYLVIAVQPLFVERMRIAKFIPPTFRYLLLAGFIAFTLFNSISFNSENINSGPTELLPLRDWYEENVPAELKGNRVAARKAHVAYYLNMDFELMPMADSYNEFITKLKEKNVDYLYFGIAEASLRNEFRFLLDRKGVHPGLEVVVYFNDPPSVLYRVIK